MKTEIKNEERSTLSIVVGTDFTEASGFAFDTAARLAQRVPGSELHLVHVFETEPSAAEAHQLIGHLRLYVNEKAAARAGLRGITVGIHLRTGTTVREIAQLAVDVRADLVVIGSHESHKRPELKSWLLGSTAERLISISPVSVLVAAPPPIPLEAHEPAIEPACADCLRARATSGGRAWWCERHDHRGVRPHTFSYQRELPFSSHDSEVIPTGIDAALV